MPSLIFWAQVLRSHLLFPKTPGSACCCLYLENILHLIDSHSSVEPQLKGLSSMSPPGNTDQGFCVPSTPLLRDLLLWIWLLIATSITQRKRPPTLFTVGFPESSTEPHMQWDVQKEFSNEQWKKQVCIHHSFCARHCIKPWILWQGSKRGPCPPKAQILQISTYPNHLCIPPT